MQTAIESKLIQDIHSAFINVALEDGISLNMTEYFDAGGTASQFLSAAENDERFDWRKILDSELQKFTVTFCFTDLKGFRFYIPAYMCWTIRNHKTNNSIIGDNTIYALEPTRHQFSETRMTQWFTPQQINTILDFLECACQHGDSIDSDVARQNLSALQKEILTRQANPTIG